MALDMEQFKATFIEESREGLDVMESNLLELQPGSTDSDSINAIFRAAHSIKGGAATFGFSDIAGFTHVAETLLDQVRNGERQITQAAITLFLKSVDCLRSMLDAAQGGDAIDAHYVSELRDQLQAMLGDEHNQTNAPGTGSAISTDNTAQTDSWQISFTPLPHLLKSGNDVVRMFRELAELGDIEVSVNDGNLPELESIEPESCYLSWNIELRGNISRAQIEEVFTWVDGDCELAISPSSASLQASPKNAAASSAPVVKPIPQLNQQKGTTTQSAPRSAAAAESSSIRVGIEKIDDLINMVGELVITQSMLNQLGGNLDELDAHRMEKMLDGLAQLERNTRELQESVMRIRMLPISFTFNRFPRLVHDMCNKLNKKIELKITGEGTELDKTVMEKIGDPLVHLVRNSSDHGIETPAERKKAGKSEIGVVHLNAFHQGGDIVIQIMDDGGGLKRDKILKKAVERGLVEADAVPNDEQIYDLLFQPGFSTADVVTDVSGRGVGMDVVRKNIQALGGRVDVVSVQGKGSTFTIRLPLTLAILDGQLVRVGKEVYILPLISIIESMQLKSGMVRSIAGKAELYRLRDEYLPIVRLYKTFGLNSEYTDLTKGLVVVVESGDGKKAGLFVDDLLSQQQVVIKSLDTNFRHVEGVSGATILGDGTVALIVDIAGMIRLAHQNINQHDLNVLKVNSAAA